MTFLYVLPPLSALPQYLYFNRQWFKANLELQHVVEIPREISFCAHTVMSEDIFIVNDAIADARFAQNPLVIKEPYIRFYVGMPIRLSNGIIVGTICVVDRKPRSITEMQATVLAYLATAVSKALEEKISAEASLGARLGFRGQAFLECVSEAVIGITLDGLIKSWNAAAEIIFGFSEDEAIGMHSSLLIPVEYRENEKLSFQRAIDGDSQHYHSFRRKSNGKIMPVSIVLVPEIGEYAKLVEVTQFVRVLGDAHNMMHTPMHDVFKLTSNQFTITLLVVD